MIGRRHGAAAAVAAALATGLTACTVAATAPAPPAPPVATTTAATVARPALATSTIPLAPEYGGTITYSVLSLSVQEKLTVLELELRPDGDLGDVSTLGQVVGTKSAARALAPELIDPVHLKAYSDADNGLSVSDGITLSLSSGTPTVLTFRYAAPQDAVTTFDVAVGSGLPTFRGVPLSR